MAASVRVEDEAFADRRFDRLARLAGLADADHARGKLLVLWRQCTIEQSHVLPADDVCDVLGEGGDQALVEARLGEHCEGGIRIRGTAGRIEWLKKLRENGKKGGRPLVSAAKTKRLTNGETKRVPFGSENRNPPAPAPAPVRVTPLTPRGGEASEACSGDPCAHDPGDEQGAGKSRLAAADPPALALTPDQPAAKRRRGAKPPGTPAERDVAGRVIAELAKLSGVAYEPDAAAHAKLVVRLLRDGRSEADLLAVVRHKAAEWGGDERMSRYLRPKTLFGFENFAGYLPPALASAARMAQAADRAESLAAEYAIPDFSDLADFPASGGAA